MLPDEKPPTESQKRIASTMARAIPDKAVFTASLPLILAADADPMMEQVYGMAFPADMFRLAIVHTALDAVRILADHPATLIISEVKLNDGSGHDLCQAVRRSDEWRNIPFIFVTPMGSTEAIVKGLEAGADDYVVKPFQMDELRARARRLMQRARL
jgi:two-component system KDP operon response regulator KdpE